MSSTRAALAAVLLVLTVGLGAGVVTASDGGLHVSISNITVSPEQPAPGERTTVTVTIRNAESSSGPYDISVIYVRQTGTTEELYRVQNPGSVPVGSTVEVPLTVTFDRVGTKDLRITVIGQGGNDNQRLSYPLNVRVAPPQPPQLNLEESQPIAGVETPLNVTISNGGRRDIESLDLRLEGEGLSLQSPRRVASALAGGAERSFSYSATFAEPGQHTVEATLAYRTADGEPRTVRESFPVQVDDPAETNRLARIELTGIGIDRTDDRVTITGSASNVGLREANSVVVRVVPAEGVTPVPPNREYFVGTVPASDFVSFDLTARLDRNVTAIPLQVDYLASGISRTARVSVPIADVDGGTTPAQRPGGEPPLLAIGAGAVVLLIAAGLAWRRWRGGGA